MGWFKRDKPGINSPEKAADRGRRSAGLWDKCPECSEFLFRDDLDANLGVCPGCEHHFSRRPDQWIGVLLDPGSFEEHDGQLETLDPLGFKDTKKYDDRIRNLNKKRGQLSGRPVSFGVFDFRFLAGSMGSVVGEKVTRMFERAFEARCPAVLLCASGGARMQEGALSLMQMAKTSAAIARLRRAGLPYAAVLLNPTTGGVAASFAMQGDVIFAEPRALVGFAGPRVIEQTIRQRLPAGFQRSEFLLEHGMLDAIVPRSELRKTLVTVLGHLLDLPGAVSPPAATGARDGSKAPADPSS